MHNRARTALVGFAAVLGACLASTSTSWATDASRPRLCAPLVVHDCYVGYVTPAGRLLVLLSSIENDPVVSLEVQVSSAGPDMPVTMLDLSKQIGSLVMLDAVGGHGIYSARIVSTADPILTALYMATFLKVPPGEQLQ